VVGVFGTSRDLTERKLNETRLAEQAELLAQQARDFGHGAGDEALRTAISNSSSR
jgi:hypothetical protein